MNQGCSETLVHSHLVICSRISGFRGDAKLSQGHYEFRYLHSWHAEREIPVTPKSACGLIKVGRPLGPDMVRFGTVMQKSSCDWLDDLQHINDRRCSPSTLNFSTSHIVSISMSITALQRVQEFN